MHRFSLKNNIQLLTRLTSVAPIFVLCTLLGNGLAHAQPIPDFTRGYVSRGCGFDMNDDDVVGDTSGAGNLPDCAVCDGNQSTGAFTADPDGDGTNEDLYWVDCNSGTDSGTGTNTPQISAGTGVYRTLSYAISQLDGAGDGQEDIICVRATCSTENGSLVNNQTLNSAGVTGQGPGGLSYNERPISGSDEVAFRYPADPFMIVGWDTDQDGQYPPFDSTQPEPAIFDADGNNDGTADASTFTTFGAADYVEVAHITVEDYGRGRSDTTMHSFEWETSSLYHHLHDIKFESVNRNKRTHSNRKVLSFEGEPNSAEWISIENVWWNNHSSWGVRGWNGTGGYIRFKNITQQPIVTTDTSNETSTGPNIIGIKMWANDNIEILDSVFINAPSNATNNAYATALYMDIDENNSVIRNNYIEGYYQGVQLHYRGSSCGGGANGPFKVENNTCTYADGDTAILGTAECFIVKAAVPRTDGLERSECDGLSASACTTAMGNLNCDSDCNHGEGIAYMQEVLIASNVCDMNDLAAAEQTACVQYSNGSNCSGITGETNVGPLRVYNNTFKNLAMGSSSTRAAVVVGRPAGAGSDGFFDYKYHPGDVYVYNNIFSGTDYTAIINHKVGNNSLGPLTGDNYYTPGTDFFADKNVYHGTARFKLGSAAVTTFGTWNTNVGSQENNSLTCTPDFEADGIHLDPSENTGCNVVDNGNDTYCATLDIDGDGRPVSTCDIGADEVVTAGTIPGTIQLSNSSYTINENGSSLTVSVSRIAGSDGAASVQYSTTNWTAVGGATCAEGVDFINATGTLNWANADSTNKTFTVTICEETLVESNESFLIQLFNNTTAGIGSPNTATVVIINNDVAQVDVPSIDSQNIKTVCSQTDASSITLSNVTVLGGASRINRELIVNVGAEGSYNSGDPLCDLSDGGVSVTWGGQALTRATAAKGISGTTVGVCSGVFYLLNPSPGTADVVVTFAATVRDIQVSAIPLYNVKQQAPFAISAFSTGTGQANSPVTTGLTTTNSGIQLIDTLALGERVGGGNIVPGGGQTEIADLSCDPAGSHTGISYKEAPEIGTHQMSWTWTLLSGEPGAYRYAHSIVGLEYDGSVDPGVTTTTTTLPSVTTTTTTLVPGTAPTTGYGCANFCNVY